MGPMGNGKEGLWRVVLYSFVSECIVEAAICVKIHEFVGRGLVSDDIPPWIVEDLGTLRLCVKFGIPGGQCGITERQCSLEVGVQTRGSKT